MLVTVGLSGVEVRRLRHDCGDSDNREPLGAFLGGEDFHWVGKTGGISVDSEKARWQALQASQIAWINTTIGGFPWPCVEGREKKAIKKFFKR